MTVVSLHTGLWGPRGRGSAHPKVADTGRLRPQGNTPEGVSPIIGPGTLPLQTPGATRNGDPWPAPGFPSQSPKRSDRLGTKPLHHDTVAGPRRGVVVVVVVVVVVWWESDFRRPHGASPDWIIVVVVVCVTG